MFFSFGFTHSAVRFIFNLLLATTFRPLLGHRQIIQARFFVSLQLLYFSVFVTVEVNFKCVFLKKKLLEINELRCKRGPSVGGTK